MVSFRAINSQPSPSLSSLLALQRVQIIRNGIGSVIRTGNNWVPAGHSGVYIEASDATVKDCLVTKNTLTGVTAVRGARTVIQDSDIFQNGQEPFTVEDSESMNTMATLQNNFMDLGPLDFEMSALLSDRGDTRNGAGSIDGKNHFPLFSESERWRFFVSQHVKNSSLRSIVLPRPTALTVATALETDEGFDINAHAGNSEQ